MHLPLILHLFCLATALAVPTPESSSTSSAPVPLSTACGDIVNENQNNSEHANLVLRVQAPAVCVPSPAALNTLKHPSLDLMSRGFLECDRRTDS